MFTENGMRVYDVEVLGVQIKQEAIASLLLDAQRTKLTLAVRTATKEQSLEMTKRLSAVEQEEASIKATATETVQHHAQKELAAIGATELAKIANELHSLEANREIVDAKLSEGRARSDAQHAVALAEAQLFVDRLKAETEQVIARAKAVTPELAAALQAVSDKALAERIATSMAPIAAMQGVSATDVLSRLFEGTPLDSILKGMASRSNLPLVGSRD